MMVIFLPRLGTSSLIIDDWDFVEGKEVLAGEEEMERITYKLFDLSV